tara:strand:- start:139 stop:783 length:645 start_codon:yes stop_codon:yes gene_type:complete
LNKNGEKIGKFISFEGGEGAGKSTQAKILAENLDEIGVKNILTREPGGTPIAEEIRDLLVKGEVGKWDPFSETLLHFAARRAHLVDKIWPALREGKWVICDRFIDSSMAYQGIAMGVGKNTIHTLSKLFMDEFCPDLTFVMDLRGEEGLYRTAARMDGKNRYEEMTLSFHQKVRHAFLEIAAGESNRCVVVDSMQPIEKISREIIDAVKQRFEV